MKFYNMGNRGLEYPVKCGSKIVIPKGAKNVKIAFEQSPIIYFDKYMNKYRHLNVYIHNNKMYYA